MYMFYMYTYCMDVFTVLLDIVNPESTEFKALEGIVSDKTLKGIEEMGFTNMTEIQHKSIVPLLKGRWDVRQTKYTMFIIFQEVNKIYKLRSL